MKLPYLRCWDNTPVTVQVSGEGIDENGVPLAGVTFEGKCNYVEKTRTVRGKDGEYAKVDGHLTIGCDIAPSLPVLKGKVTIQDRTWNIYSADRPRNPDGTVNHTRLELTS